MRSLMALVIAVSVVAGSAGVAFAQEEESKVQFIVIEGMNIDGTISGPDSMLVNRYRRAEFGPLVELKRSFVPQIREATQSLAMQ